MKRFLYPHIPLRAIPRLLLIALYGSLIAGLYGILHDQITFTLSPEYFTNFKFEQFDYADFGLGDRIFAGTIGFLATFWIGAIAGWIFGRLSLSPGETRPKTGRVLRAMLVMLLISMFFAGAGYLYGTLTMARAEARWSDWKVIYGISDIAAFARVGQIHNLSYLGGAVGSIVAGLLLKRQV